MNASDILKKADEIINGERQEEYGDRKENFQMIADLWGSYLSEDISAEDVANMMILLKVARIKNGKKMKYDSFVDICGYAAIEGELASRYPEV